MAAGKAASKPPEPTEQPTERVVLRQEKVFVISNLSLTPEEEKKLATALKDCGIKDTTAHMAWIECGVHPGSSKEQSIEAYAGKPGTADAKPGTFKAVPVKSFAGGKRHRVPEKPLVESEAIE